MATRGQKAVAAPSRGVKNKRKPVKKQASRARQPQNDQIAKQVQDVLGTLDGLNTNDSIARFRAYLLGRIGGLDHEQVVKTVRKRPIGNGRLS